MPPNQRFSARQHRLLRTGANHEVTKARSLAVCLEPSPSCLRAFVVKCLPVAARGQNVAPADRIHARFRCNDAPGDYNDAPGDYNDASGDYNDAAGGNHDA